MLGNEKLSHWQMFLLIVLFELGSALVVGPGLASKQAVWITILFGMCVGIVNFVVYSYLHSAFPRDPITTYVQKILGKYIGWPLGLLYSLFFIYQSSRNVRDYGALLTSSILDQTPLLIINVTLILVLIYVLRLGFVVLGRMAEIYFMILIGLGIVANIFIISSGIIKFQNLFPILQDGWLPVIKVLPLTSMFPFSEIVAFTALLPFLGNSKGFTKIGVIAIVLSGILLSYTATLNIAVLGPDIAPRSPFALLATIRKVNIAEFIQRLDPIVILTLIIGNLFKTAIYFYAGVVGLASLFKIDNVKKLVYPMGFVIIYMSMLIADNFIEHLTEGLKAMINYVYPIMTIAIPFLLMVITFLRKKSGNNQA